MPEPPMYSRRRLILESVTAASAYALAASQPDLGALGQTAREPRPATHHRTVVGSRDVLVLSDGHLVVPAGMLAGNVSESEVRSFLAARAVGPERVHFHINVALVKTGDDYVLIDAGSGGTWELTAGQLADSLEAADIKPDQIGTVVVPTPIPTTSGV